MRNPLVAILVAVMLSLAWGSPAFGTTVAFDFTQMTFTYDRETGVVTVNETSGSDAIFNTIEDGTVTDTAKIVGGSLFDANLDLIVSGDSGNYTLTGTFSATDDDLGSDAILATFTSTSVEVTPIPGTGVSTFTVSGVLKPADGASSILAGPNPWVYEGTTGGPEDADGNLTTITVSDPGSYTEGILFQLYFGTSAPNLDTFFGQDRLLQGGNVKGSVNSVVPEPSSLAIAAFGLAGLAFSVRRKRKP